MELLTLPAIILNYNSAADCCKCVSYLQQQTGVNVEIIIVDNASQPDDRVSVARLCNAEHHTLLVSLVNGGYSAGNNIGLKYATQKGYTYALIANPDMEFPQTDTLVKMVTQMEKDSNIAALGIDVIGADGRHQNPMKRDGDWRTALGWIKDLLRRKHHADDYIDNYTTNHYCDKLGGCCLMLRLSHIEKIGYLDEYPFLYCEEAILSRQIEQAGYRMCYLAEVQAVHRHVKSAKGNPVERFRQWHRSRCYFIDKYSGDNRWGRWVTKNSMSLYVATMIVACKIRRLYAR